MMWSAGKTSAIGVSARPGHFRFFGGTFVAVYSFVPACRVERLAEQLLAASHAVGVCGVEEVAAELDGAIERSARLVIVGAGPAAHAPHAVADFGDLPVGTSKASIAHDKFYVDRLPVMRSVSVALRSHNASDRPAASSAMAETGGGKLKGGR